MSERNKKTVVVYKTKYGSAKQYAEWIAEEVEADIFTSSQVSVEDLAGYETIIYGGSLYAVGILGISLIKKNFDRIRDKNVIIFSVGISPDNEKALEAVRNNNFTDEMKDAVHYFHLRGAFDYNKLTFLHRMLMLVMKKMIELKKPENRSKDEEGLLESFEHPVDFKTKEATKAITDYVKSL